MFFFADFAERDVTPKKRFSVVVSCSTSFHRKNRLAEKSFSVVVRQQAEGFVSKISLMIVSASASKPFVFLECKRANALFSTTGDIAAPIGEIRYSRSYFVL